MGLSLPIPVQISINMDALNGLNVPNLAGPGVGDSTGGHHVAKTLGVETAKEAAAADEIEHKQTLAQAFAVHKKAIFWSMALSGALIMEGYDVVVIGSFYGHREWARWSWR